MSAIQPIPQVVEKFGEAEVLIVAAYRPPDNGFGRRVAWLSAIRGSEVRVSRSALKRLKDQGFTKVRVQTAGEKPVVATFEIEELLND